MRDVCLCMQVDALVCSEIERENTPRCTRYAFQWAGYQRRIHPTFPCWNASVLFSPSLSFSLPLSLSRLSLGRGLLRLVHTCSTLKNAAPTEGTHSCEPVAFYVGKTRRNARRVSYFSARNGFLRRCVERNAEMCAINFRSPLLSRN